MQVRLVLTIGLLAGCGRVGFSDRPDGATERPAPDTPVDAGGCPASYNRQFGGLSRYRLDGPDTWANGERACEADGRGMHLIVLDDMVELQASESFEATPFWIGLSDRITDGSFLLVTGGPAALEPWEPGYPTVLGAGCVVFAPLPGTIGDTNCDFIANYVCECDGVPAQPGSY